MTTIFAPVFSTPCSYMRQLQGLVKAPGPSQVATGAISK